MGVKNGERKLYSRNTKGAFFKSARLFFLAVRGVVGGDTVYSSVQDTLQKGLSVLFTAQRRVHFKSAFFFKVCIRKHKVVGGGFAGYIQPFGFGFAYKLHAFLGGYVAYVVCAPRFPHQSNVSFNLLPFAFTANALVPVGFGVFTVVYVTALQKVVYFAVGNYHFSKGFGFKHCRPHHIVGLYAAPVIGKGNNVPRHILHIGKLFSHFPLCYCAVRENINAGIEIYYIKLLF